MISYKIFIFTRTVEDACPYKMLSILNSYGTSNKNLYSLPPPLLFFCIQEPIDGDVQDLCNLAQLVIGNESRADLNAGNAVTFDDDPLYLQACGEVALCHAKAAARLVDSFGANICYAFSHSPDDRNM